MAGEGITSNPRESLDREHLALLLEASELLTSSLDIEEILNILMDQVIKVINAERGFILLRDEIDREWQFRTARAIDRESIDRDDFRISRSLVDRVAREGVSLLTSDALQDRRFRDQKSVSLFALKSILCVPLCIQGRILGVIYADNRMESGVFGSREKALLESIARQAASALENARLYDTLKRIHEESMEKARKELAETQAQLFQSSKMAAVGQLAAGVAHEINNPLGAIALNISSVRKALSDERLQKRLDIMENATAKCKDIVQQLLRFSHPAFNAPEKVNVCDLLSSTLTLMEFHLRKENIDLQLRVEEPLIVIGNLGELSQVITNILMNARDALKGTPPEHRRTILVKASEKAEKAVLEISDNGPGIDESVRERIFEPFFTTKGVGEGVGLGLSISFQIIKKYNGEIAVTSQPGRGTCFILSFPRAR